MSYSLGTEFYCLTLPEINADNVVNGVTLWEKNIGAFIFNLRT